MAKEDQLIERTEVRSKTFPLRQMTTNNFSGRPKKLPMDDSTWNQKPALQGARKWVMKCPAEHMLTEASVTLKTNGR